jgi:citrate lyase subunit beta / citryl-CoA lyase
MIRSMLFVPADSEKKLSKAASCKADALILDLEDSVLPDRKPTARAMAKEYMSGSAEKHRLWVRVNDLYSGELLNDLIVIVAAKPVGIVFPKIRGPEDIEIMRRYLEALEANYGLVQGGISLAVIVTETPSAVLRLGEVVARPQPRVQALMWGAEDLSSAIGAGDPRAADGAWRPAYQQVRSQCLFASHALGVEAIDTVYVNFKDPEGLRASSLASRYDGFTGRVAIHPDQVDIINDAFTPSAAELALARRVIAAFESGAVAVSIDGKMYDIPHLKAARRLLGSAPAS